MIILLYQLNIVLNLLAYSYKTTKQQQGLTKKVPNLAFNFDVFLKEEVLRALTKF